MTFLIFSSHLFSFFNKIKHQFGLFSFLMFIFLNIGFQNSLLAQTDSTTTTKENMVEDVISGDDTRDVDAQLLNDRLEGFKSRKINLNKATAQDLNELGVLNAVQVQNFINYRKTAGNLINEYELQAIPTFDLNIIKSILPYVTLNATLDDNQKTLGEMWRESNSQIMMRWERNLPLASGYTDGNYQGLPDVNYLRFRKSYGNKLSVGFTLEKDAGEPYLDKVHHIYGADFYSFHAFAKNVNHRIKAIALGDFASSFGQGLILYQDFAAGKSTFVMDIRRMQPTLRAFTSVNEFNFMRGAGATFNINKNVESTVFASYRKLDASSGDIDALPDDLPLEGGIFFANVQKSGFHRTSAELDNRQTVKNTTLGANVVYQKEGKRLAFNALYNQFDQPLIRQNNKDLYTKYLFAGKNLLNLSADYAFNYRNLQAFGEIAYSDNNRIASLNSILLTLDKRVSFSVVHRYFPKDFWVLQSNPYAESTTTNNENGIYAGVELFPTNYFKLSAFADFWQHPWFRSLADAPNTRGREYLVKATLTKKRKLETYLQYRFKEREINNAVNQIVTTPRHQFRWNLSYIVAPGLELRSRAEMNVTTIKDGTIQKGFLVYQDAILKSKTIPLATSARIAFFDTGGFDSRIYTYEEDLLYNYSAPAFANKGIRYYINVRYTLFKKLTVEGRVAQVYYENLDVIGSGNEQIQGNRKTEVKVQVRYSF